MNFEEIKIQHLALQKEYRLGNLSAEMFRRKAEALKTQTPDGIWWRVKIDGSGWEKLSGTEWVKAKPDAQTEMPNDDIYVFPSDPSTTRQFLKQWIAKVIQSVKQHLIPVIIIFAAVLLVGLYLNFGDRIGLWRFYNFMIAVFGDKWQVIAKILSALTLTFMIAKLVIVIISKKLSVSIRRFLALPKKIGMILNSDRKSSLIVLLICATICALLTYRLANILLCILLSVFFLTAATDRNNGLFLPTALILSDIKKILHHDPTVRISPITMGFAGLGLGALVGICPLLLPQLFAYIFFAIWTAAVIVLIVLAQNRKAA